jgi:enoyl-CoA hydratase
MGRSVTVEDRGGIALVRVDRPPANALDPGLLADAVEVLAELRAASPDAVVLTGAGRFFSGGADLKAVPLLAPTEQAAMVTGINQVFTGWYGFPRPVVAAVNGHAIAGGLILALCADMRIVGPDGSFGVTEVKVGIPYPVAAMAVVRAELAPPVARRLVLTAELIDAPSAVAAGVFDELVVDAGLVVDRALEVARGLADLPRSAYEIVKQQLRGDTVARLERMLADGTDPMLERWATREVSDAAAATLRSDH